jgi:hypothetical protein
MARVELFLTVDKVFTDPDVTGNMMGPAVGVNVTINNLNGTPTVVYANESTGDTTTTLPNPLVTDSEGRVKGWLNEGSYRLVVSGAGITNYAQTFEAVKGDSTVHVDGARINPGTIPNAALVNDTITSDKIAAKAITGAELALNVLPVGTVIDWWVPPPKPATGYIIPTGWAVCNGQTLGIGQHEFPDQSGSVTLPNLLDKVTLGADPAQAYGNPAQGASQPPSMGGDAGSNQQSFAHTHNHDHAHLIPAHGHNVAAHQHGMFHQHGVWIRDHVHGLPLGKSGSTSGPNQIVTPNGNATFGTGGWAEVTDAGNKGITDAAGSYTSDQTGGLVTSPLSANPGQEFTQSAQGNVNMRPRYYGMVKLMKVRNL